MALRAEPYVSAFSVGNAHYRQFTLGSRIGVRLKGLYDSIRCGHEAILLNAVVSWLRETIGYPSVFGSANEDFCPFCTEAGQPFRRAGYDSFPEIMQIFIF
jgi:hypothetical protein